MFFFYLDQYEVVLLTLSYKLMICVLLTTLLKKLYNCFWSFGVGCALQKTQILHNVTLQCSHYKYFRIGIKNPSPILTELARIEALAKALFACWSFFRDVVRKMHSYVGFCSDNNYSRVLQQICGKYSQLCLVF